MGRNSRDPENAPHVKTEKAKRIYSLRNGGRGQGKIVYAWQKSSGTLLASAVEGNPVVFIHNRQGHIQQQIPTIGNCSDLAWDEDGDYLAIVTEGSSIIMLWDSHSDKVTEIDSNVKDPGSCLAWSKVGKTFAYGTTKGNLLVYNHKTMRKVPIIGKHSKKIICCAWSNDNCLALGSADNFMSVNTIDGDAIKTVQLRGKPHDIKFGNIKEDHISGAGLENTVSAIVAEKTLYLLRLEDGAQAAPLELGFQQRYGNLISHHWHGDGYILASFAGGYIVEISTHPKEIGTELALVELEYEPLRWTAMCHSTSQICVCYGDTNIEIRDARDPKRVICTADIEDEGRLRPAVSCHFSDDGQLVGVVTSPCDLHVFLTSVPLLGSSCENFIVQMNSLTEMTLSAIEPSTSELHEAYNLSLEFEPTLINLGPGHIAAALNNRVWYFSLADMLSDPPSDRPMFIKVYNSNVLSVQLNNFYTSVLCGDQIFLHPIDSNEEMNDLKVFQETKGTNKITCHAITKEFLIFGTDSGMVRLFHIDSWEEINHITINPKSKLRKIYPDYTGCKLVITDKDGLGFLVDLGNDMVEPIKQLPSRSEYILWDTTLESKNIFVSYSPGSLTVDIFTLWKTGTTVWELHYLPNVRVFTASDNLPLTLKDGIIHSQTSGGTLSRTNNFYLDKSEFLDSTNGPQEKLAWLIGLKKFKEAYNFTLERRLHETNWQELAKAATENTSLLCAARVYKHLDEFGAAYNLYKILKIDDWRQVSGYIAMLSGNFDAAEKSFLQTNDKTSALNLRCDLQHWDDALKLALEFKPERCAEIATKRGENEETKHNWAKALESYELAARYANEFDISDCLGKAEAGIARAALRCGQMTRGLQVLRENNVENSVKLQCAQILEDNKFFNDAAELFEAAGEYEHAASLFLRNRQWEKITPLLPYISSKKVHLQYAKGKEAEGKFYEAAKAYAEAGDVENACRLYLKAGSLDEAITVSRKLKSTEGAEIISKYFVNTGDIDTALRYLLLLNCHKQATEIAIQNERYESYAEMCLSYVANDVESCIMPEEVMLGLTQIAEHYEALRDHFKAAKYHYHAGNVEKAFQILLKAGTNGVISNEQEFLALLLKCIVDIQEVKPHDNSSAEKYIEFILGDKDGNPKDLKYLMEFYALTGRTNEAVKSCLVYCMDYLADGNYKSAHQCLLETVCNIRISGSRIIPFPIYDSLKIVHFYNLARIYASQSNYEASGRILKLLLPHYEIFRLHCIQFLTLTVIQCSKAGLKASALEACQILMKPEYRHNLDPQYKQKFELMVRKKMKGKEEPIDVPGESSPCPNCNESLPNYEHYCYKCQTDIPYCIFSGRHLIPEDFTICPYCEFPGILSEFISAYERSLKTGSHLTCLMCEKRLPMRAFQPRGFIKSFLNYKFIGSDKNVV